MLVSLEKTSRLDIAGKYNMGVIKKKPAKTLEEGNGHLADLTVNRHAVSHP